MIYLHGRIVQVEQSARPVHPELGAYELEMILAAFRERGFVVHGGIRPRQASVSEAADAAVAEVRALLDARVPAERITLVGASMGGAIALLAAARLGEPELGVAVLGVCISSAVPQLVDERGRSAQGRVLAVREASDELTAGCAPWSAELAPAPGLDARELVVDTGLRHGFLYRPRPEWLEPVVAWARRIRPAAP